MTTTRYGRSRAIATDSLPPDAVAGIMRVAAKRAVDEVFDALPSGAAVAPESLRLVVDRDPVLGQCVLRVAIEAKAQPSPAAVVAEALADQVRRAHR